MANLNAYINFQAVFTKTSSSSALALTDPGNYPGAVPENLVGYFVITQPDGITITGSYASPDIYWNGSQLVTATKELRLRADGQYQQGIYTIQYFISAPGYDETTLLRSVNITYLNQQLIIDPDLDVFTPNLQLTDETDYAVSGYNTIYVSRAWSFLINSVEGTPQGKSGPGNPTFSLNYLGASYDANYTGTISVQLSYQIQSASWAFINNTITKALEYDVYTPPTIAGLLESITALKAQIDASNCICGSSCGCQCSELLDRYKLAVSIFIHIIERGRESQLTDLDDYVLQLQKLLNNCVTPTLTHSNEAISPYDWGGGSGSSSFAFYKQMIVGSGVNNAPADGAIDYVDAGLIGKNIQLFLDGLLLGSSLSDRQSYIFDNITGTITWQSQLWAPSLISIYTF